MRESAARFEIMFDKELRLNITKKRTLDIVVDFRKSDYKHLCGAQYFNDDISQLKQLNAEKFFDDALCGGEFSTKIINSSKFIDGESRIDLTGKIENILYGNYCVYNYIKKPWLKIEADYFLLGEHDGKETYLFIRKRKGEETYAPVSIFYKDTTCPRKEQYEYNQRPYTTAHRYCVK